ncbi:MAG: hypothetical protein WCD70_12430 [Alphaproteobacteria bacterium]
MLPTGASYKQVARSAVIRVHKDLPEESARSVFCQREFREEMNRLAYAMAKTKVSGSQQINRPLLSKLIEAFRTTDCAVITTQDQISSQRERSESLVFMLHHPGYPLPRSPVVAKPHKGRLVLFTGEDNELYIPVPISEHDASLIPLRLTTENVELIGGAIGKSLSDAFKSGVKDLTQHKTAKPRIRREADQAHLDREEMAEHMRQPPILRRCNIG